MTRLRRRARPTDLFAAERPPRLVLRFALVLSVALGLASAVILVVVHHFAVTSAERAATRHASLVASTLLQREVRPDDLSRVVSPARRGQLDTVFGSQFLTDDILEIALVRQDGVVTYSTNHAAIGTGASGELASEAAVGTIVSRIASALPAEGQERVKALETYTPALPGASPGSALIVQPYAPIQRDARTAQVRVGGVLQALLLVLFLVFVPLLARVTRRIEAQIARIHFQAYFDTLTGLPNRTNLFQRLDTAVGRAASGDHLVAVLLVDLDRFREINDTLGHDVGDCVLVEAASRLRATAGEECVVARMSGDEFAVVAEFRDKEEAVALAERLRAELETPVTVDEMPLSVEGSVGIAFYPDDGRDAETLLKHAEVATQTAKQWRTGVLGYSPAVDPYDPEQLRLASAVREAAQSGQLRPHYQPKIDLATGAVAGFESLSYWQHPTRGLLPPGAFIPVAERTGAIRYVTRTVLRHAVEQLDAWSDTDLTISVNLTPIDLLDAGLVKRLRHLLRQHEVDPGRLCLELTESTVMADPDRAHTVLERIAATGVRISIDDFGTGHSSLAYLKDLPVSEVKIDRSFISDMGLSRNNWMIVKATIQLGHSLGLDIVAEGVEDPEIASALLGLGCDYAQGYLYGRAMPVEEVADLLGRQALAAA